MIEIFDDIRKLYLFKLPCLELVSYIEFFSETSLTATRQHIDTEEFTVKLFPSYTPTIWINLGSAYILKNGSNWKVIDESTDVLVLRNEIIERKNLPSDNIFTIKFHPGGLEAVFGVSQAKIASEIINASEIICPQMLQKLKSSSCFNDRVTLLQELFLSKLNQHRKTSCYFNYIQQATALFCASGFAAKNNELAEKLGLSEKNFYRYLTKTIGINPKQYMAILRARTALTAYINKPADFNPYAYGYFDSSHFYKDVLKFTGKTLSTQLS
ncbi:helix-turn-helix domain-containing protein [Pedobacter caeni]|uniref:Helix-turn-helix domain-containing protein n=1 Tax=Pedobacter caeni TaxID=288992 RepID=A0A1M5A1E7_9SPHI|nr:helix-turn-helix domain-containing protein [Pedobacter caeni]SHF24034.1 Helix-turn-helix domain-containing protein [Pedobacter caeni]